MLVGTNSCSATNPLDSVSCSCRATTPLLGPYPRNPLHQIRLLQHDLCFHSFTKWITPGLYEPRTIQVQIEDEQAALDVQVHTPTTVQDLIQAERQGGDWGCYVIVKHQQARLPLDTQLFPGLVYAIQRKIRRQLKPVPEEHHLFGGGPSHRRPMLGDHLLHCVIQSLIEHSTGRPTPFTLHPFQVTHFLRLDLPAKVTDTWKQRWTPCHRDILLTCELHGHWILLHGASDTTHLNIRRTFYDGLRPESSRPWILQVVSKMTQILGINAWTLQLGESAPQLDNFTCGTLALLQCAKLLGLLDHFTYSEATVLHRWLLDQQRDQHSELMSHIFAGGGDQWQQQLQELLVTKGVPAVQAAERSQLVITKLGPRQVQELLRKKNPWAELKSAANQPGKMFRLVTMEEQRDYIDLRARTKHGAH